MKQRKIRKLYGYDSTPKRTSLKLARLVSERKLPEPNQRFRGICCGINVRSISEKEIMPGVRNDLVFGDPIVMRGTKMLSILENPIPECATRIRDFLPEYVVVFLYHGARVWTNYSHLSTLADVTRADWDRKLSKANL